MCLLELKVISPSIRDSKDGTQLSSLARNPFYGSTDHREAGSPEQDSSVPGSCQVFDFCVRGRFKPELALSNKSLG